MVWKGLSFPAAEWIEQPGMAAERMGIPRLMRPLHRIVTGALLAAIIASATPSAVYAENIEVAILIHDSLKSTTRTLHGAKKVIARNHPEASFQTFLVGDDPAEHMGIVDSLSKLKPRLLLTVGSSATEFAKTNFADIPIVFSAVKYPVLSGFVESMQHPGGNVTGASLDIPIDIQFRYFSEVVSDLSRIGVLYTDNTASLIDKAEQVARQSGLELVPVAVNDPKDLPAALDSLASTTDGLWSVADPNLFDPRATRYILLNTIRKGLPLMGFSRHVVESGALFALDFDYKAIGFQAGGLASRVIEGENPADIPVTMADVIWFHYNEKTAEHINLPMPEELVAIAKEVYR
jgi:putative ABC transport system substrate-binding protein